MQYSNYIDLLKQTKQHYQCVGFDVLQDSAESAEHIALIRHDIDFSTKHALELAKIEADMGVQATFTVLLTSDFYSPMALPHKQNLREIARLGHKLGLHFDVTAYDIKSEDDITAYLAMERQMLANILDVPLEDINMFSFHNTSPFSMSCRELTYAGMVNAYAKIIFDHFSYASDSNGYWRHTSWQELMDKRPKRMQVLCHPLWWSQQDAPPARRVLQVMRDHAAEQFDRYCDLFADGQADNKLGVGQKNRGGNRKNNDPLRENRTGLSQKHTRFLMDAGACGRTILWSYLEDNHYACFIHTCYLMEGYLAIHLANHLAGHLADKGVLTQINASTHANNQSPSKLLSLSSLAKLHGVFCHIESVQKALVGFFTLDLNTGFQPLLENMLDEASRLNQLCEKNRQALHEN